MENLQKLYNVLTQQGLYTKSYDEFEQQYQDEAYRDKVYNVAVQQGLYTKSQDEFNQQYSLGDTVVSSEEIVEDVEVKDGKKKIRTFHSLNKLHRKWEFNPLRVLLQV